MIHTRRHHESHTKTPTLHGTPDHRRQHDRARQKTRARLYVTESATCIDWDEDTILGVGDYIVTDADGRLVGVHDGTELLQNYIIQETP